MVERTSGDLTNPAQAYGPGTGLVVVDVQNDFADPAGSLSVPGGEDVIAQVNAHVAAAVAAGSPVFYTQDWHPPATPHFVDHGGPWPPHCVRGTWGSELHPDLDVRGEVVRKGVGNEDGYSGFTMRDTATDELLPTGLEAKLRDAGVARVVVVGLATDYCVKATALDGLRLGFDVVVPTDAVAAVELSAGDGAAALAELVDAGARVG